jgi:3'-5' exoribonuclease
MKTQFVEALQEGDALNDYFVAIRKDLRTQQNGGKFLGMVFKDRTGEVGGILWNNAPAIAKLFDVGDVVNVRGSVVTYQGRLQVRVEQVVPLKESEYKLVDLEWTPQNTEETLASFRAALEEVEEPTLRALNEAFLSDEEFMDRFAGAAAGKRWHHAYAGGLVQHCLEMARLVKCTCELYPALNRDLMLTAVFLHDVGKLDEMSHGLYVDYTNPGKLLGHLTIGADMIQQRMRDIPDFPESLRLHLLHLVFSHHGELENGSPIVPKTPEAIALHYCDNLSAQTEAYLRIAEDTRDNGQEWSEYISLIGRQIWGGPREG